MSGKQPRRTQRTKRFATDLHSVAKPQPKPNIHHGDPPRRAYSTEVLSHGENRVEKQNQKQEQNQNPRTAENTEQVQERMEIDENLREKRRFQRLVIQIITDDNISRESTVRRDRLTRFNANGRDNLSRDVVFRTPVSCDLSPVTSCVS